MKIIWKIKHWFWWNFRATDMQKAKWQQIFYGAGIMKEDKFVDIKKFYRS